MRRAKSSIYLFVYYFILSMKILNMELKSVNLTAPNEVE